MSQLVRLKKKRAKKTYPGYLLMFTVILILMRITNELSSNISTFIQSSVVNEFYVRQGLSYEAGLARFTGLSISVSMLALLSVFYKPLADVLGRKAVLCVNTAATAAGMLLIFASPTVVVYCLGTAVCSFFTQNDVQMVYILETAPKDRGAGLFGLIKSFGILGLLIIPILRQTVMNNDAARWRSLYLAPAVVCILICVLLLLFCRESRLFLDRRISFLEHGKERKESSGNLSLGASIRYILKNQNLRASIIAYSFYGLCSMAAYMYVESIMTTNGMTAEDVTKALYVYPFVYAAMSFLGGGAADRWGRKAVVVTTGGFVAAGFLMFVWGCARGWDPILVGFLNGIYLGGYWVCGDYISVLFLEKVPTQLRASVLAGANVLMMAGCFLGIAAQMLLMLKVGLNLASLLIIVPCISCCVLVIAFRVKETRGTDLKDVE